ncbi:hypothetical protein [Devosia sp. A449]
MLKEYPTAEVQSWTIQKQEAEAVIAGGEAATHGASMTGLSSIASFLVSVCEAHRGEVSTDAERGAQLWVKAAAIKANAGAWAGLSAYVNGLRARMEDRLALAQTVSDLLVIESENQAELGAFRAVHHV